MSAPISEVVNVSVSIQNAGVTRQGFGTALIAAYHTLFADRVRTYSQLSEMIADGFTVNHPAYKAAAKLIGQNPRVRNFKIGKRVLPPTQKHRFTPTDTTVGRVYSITFTSPAGVVSTATYTVQNADTLTLITTGLVAAVNALAIAVTVTNNTTNFDVQANTAGALWDIDVNDSPLTVKNSTTDPGIATDLAAIALADNDWYGLALDSNGALEVAAAAAWVESNEKIAAFDTIDSDTGTSSTSDIMSTVKTASYKRSLVIRAKNALSYAGAAALGVNFPTDPGKATLAYKTLSGVSVPNLNTTERGYIKGKNGNFLTTMGGVNVLLFGKCGSGYFDDQRMIDCLTARLRENLFALLVNNPKLPFSDASIDLVKGEVLATISRFQPYAILTTPAPTVTFPKASEVSAVDKGNRLLPDGEFTATIAGAIHEIEITGKLVL